MDQISNWIFPSWVDWSQSWVRARFFGHEWRKIDIWVSSTHFEWAPAKFEWAPTHWLGGNVYIFYISDHLPFILHFSGSPLLFSQKRQVSHSADLGSDKPLDFTHYRTPPGRPQQVRVHPRAGTTTAMMGPGWKQLHYRVTHHHQYL